MAKMIGEDKKDEIHDADVSTNRRLSCASDPCNYVSSLECIPRGYFDVDGNCFE